MKTMTLKVCCPLIVIELLSLSFICQAQFSTFQPVAAQASVTTGLHTARFCKALGLPQPSCGGADNFTPIVYYYFPRKKAGVPGPLRMTIAVCLNAQKAAQTYKALLREGCVSFQVSTAYGRNLNRLMAGGPPSEKGIGDQFNMNFVPGGKNGDGVEIAYCLRRGNVVIGVRCSGDLRGTVALARKMDTIIRTDTKACPKGRTIVVPTVTFVTLPGHYTLQHYFTGDGSRILPADTPDKQAASSGDVTVWKGEREVQFFTQDNVPFTVPGPLR